jgi:flagellar hook-length control protein FliK
MTMSMVGAPTANPVPRPAADGDAPAGQPGTEPAGDRGFPGLVAALVAAIGQPPANDPAVPPTADPQSAAAPDEPGLERLGGDVADHVGLPAETVPPGIEALVIGAPVTGPVGVVATAAAVTAVATPVITPPPAPPTSAPVEADPTASAPCLPSGPADSTDAEGQAPSTQGRPAEPQASTVAGSGPTGGEARPLGRALGAAVVQIRDAKTSDPVAAPGAATGPAAPVPAALGATPTTAPAAAPATPGGTAAQLAPAVFAVHRRGVDGEHHLTLDITPEYLGPVRMTVSLRDGQVHMLLAGSSELSREALRAALPELRKLVEGAGIVAGAFDVTPDQSGTGRGGPDLGRAFGDAGRGSDTPSGPQPGPSTPASERAVTAPSGAATSSRSLDLHL